MRKFFLLLLHPWTLAAIGLLALALVVVFIGPLVSIGTWQPLATPTAQWVLIGAVLSLFLIFKAVGWWRSRSRNREVVDGLAAGKDAKPGEAESAELVQLKSRFEAALTALRDSRLGGGGRRWWATWINGKRYLYELPWFAIVGAPGSGKTTTLLHSGLRFPLADLLGVGSVKGIGGTRNCDWWFADQAVLLDTAGRYTTHDSDPEHDKQAWEAFLALLKRARPRRPLNGVLVTVSVADLLVFSAAQRAEHAATLRRRVDELQQHLGLRLPVYLLLTKCDLLAGFMDYFADGSELERGQPWGFTFDPADSRQGTVAARFGPEFDALTQRLLDGVIDRVQAERDRARRARVYGFPLQFGALRAALAQIVEAVGAPSSYGAAPLVRGVYFTSGTQEGTPFDRLLGAVARELRLERSVQPANRATGRSFFVSQVLSDIVFAEAELAGANLGWERRRSAIVWTSYAALAVVGALLMAGWTLSYLNNRAQLSRFAAQVADLKARIDTTPSRASGELVPIEPALSAAADLAAHEADIPWTLGLGLYQGDKLHDAAGLVYRRMLADGLLPRIALRIEELLQSAGENTQLLYEALKSYVMLHSPPHYDPKVLRRFIGADWDANLAGQLTPEQRTALDRHLRALFDLPVASSPLAQDRELMARVRERISGQPLAQRVYTRLKWLGVGEGVPEFTVQTAAGPQANSVFVRRSGLPLSRGVPGLYTYDGYHKAFQGAIAPAALELAAEEPWVLATDARRAADPGRDLQLIEQVRRSYLNDYIENWESFIADIHLAPTANLAQALQQARILSGPDTPLAALLRALVHQTTLTVSIENQGLIERAQARAADAIQESRQSLARLFGADARAATPAGGQPEQIVDDRFTSLRAMVQAPGAGAPAQLDTTIALIGEVYNLLNSADIAIRGGNEPPKSELPAKLSAEAGRLPEPLQSLLAMLSAASQRWVLSGVGDNLSRRLNAEIGQPCLAAVSDRYPFNRSSDREVRPADFSHLFAPGGKFDEFFTRELAAYVDTSTRPWSTRRLGGARMSVSAATLAQFQRAAAIRDTFFPGGGRDPNLRLEFIPFDMDPNITQFSLDVDGQLVQWAFGPKIARTVAWPGPRGSNQIRVALLPAGPGGSGMVIDGPWAPFRLFDRMQVENMNSPERFRLTFNIEGRRAAFDVTAASVQNPFAMREMSEFHCPTTL